MLLAAGIDQYIYLIAAAAYGVFAWWNDRRQKKALAEEEAQRAAQPKPAEADRRSESTPAPSAPANSEEERMRKFLEALGVPSTPQSPPLRPAQSAPARQAQPSPPKPASPTMAPRPVAMPIPRAFPVPAKPQPRPRPVAPALQPTGHSPEMRSAETAEVARLTETDATFDQVSADFSRMHTQPMATDNLPSIATAAQGAAGTTRVDTKAASSQGLALRELLRNPESLRAAIVVSEVLGPPKGA